jgi:hypothetical protein
MAIDNKLTKPQNIVQSAASDLISGVTGNVKSAIASASPLNDFGKYFSGLRAIIKVNDQLFGFAFGVSLNLKFDTEEIWTIDNYQAYELAPRKMIATGTISMFHIPGKGPGIQNVHPNGFSFLMHRYISLDISDQMTGESIFKTEKAMITGRTQDVDANKISTIRLEWKAIEWVTENDLNNTAEDRDKPASEGQNSVPLLNSIKNLF